MRTKRVAGGAPEIGSSVACWPRIVASAELLPPHQALDRFPVGPVEPDDGIAPSLPARRRGDRLLQSTGDGMRLRGKRRVVRLDDMKLLSDCLEDAIVDKDVRAGLSRVVRAIAIVLAKSFISSSCFKVAPVRASDMVSRSSGATAAAQRIDFMLLISTFGLSTGVTLPCTSVRTTSSKGLV